MLDTNTIESIVGKKGTMTDDVLRLTQPRQDLKVTLDGFEIVPFMGLTSWVAFRQAQHHTTMMGDIVLLEDETNAAVSAAIESDLYATALHNHYVREQPRIMFMHIEGTADEATLARGVRTVFDGIEVVRKAHPVPPSAKQVRSDLD